jgi:putative ATP-dependent endonuclease of the OLD family
LIIKKLRISNFRSIKFVELELSATTVLIGPNNAGKTAILEAIRIALTRRWGLRGTGFTEYDVHLNDARTDPKVGDPVVIEVDLQESEPEDWPEDLQNDLADIIQLDPVSNKCSITLRVSCSWDAAEEGYIPRWEFLNVNRKPLTGKGARAVNFQEFFQYVPVFYLEALRDAGDEFSVKSQFWGKLLKTVQIPEALEKRSKRVFDLLNVKLLNADPKLGKLALSLSDISTIASADLPGKADLRVLPLNTWDLLSKAEVIYQSESNKPWLPLLRHGQGVQSLSVMFLFKSFIELLIDDLFPAGSEAVLALEEPETHLHPQAARSLWRHISALPGQKIVTTHSPYFLQHVPFRDLRVIRSGENGTSVRSLPRQFSAQIPYVVAIDSVLVKSGGEITYDRGLGELVAHGLLNNKRYRELLSAYAGNPEMAQIHAAINKLFIDSQCFIEDRELDQLETFARRIRGEIFFARRWLLVEGPTDYNLMHGVAEGLGYNLDEHGVAVIDFKNNGNPGCFASLARALGYPWLIFVDGDDAGKKYMASLNNRGFTEPEIKERGFILDAGFIEQQLVADGLQTELKEILKEIGLSDVDTMIDNDLIEALIKNKTTYSSILAKKCSENPALSNRMPKQLVAAINKLKGLE